VPFKSNSRSDPTLPLEGPNPLIFSGLFSKEYFSSQLESIWSVCIFLSAIKLFPQYLCNDIFPLVHIAKKFLFAEHMAFVLTIVLKPGRSKAGIGPG
jgi:hypothetical protein